MAIRGENQWPPTGRFSWPPSAEARYAQGGGLLARGTASPSHESRSPGAGEVSTLCAAPTGKWPLGAWARCGPSACGQILRGVATDFKTIRAWDGSQDRAFEELCYQLRDATPPGARLIKTGDPDGGLEWYVRHGNGVEWGWQAKYSFDIETLLKLMEKSLKTVVAKRPSCRRLTFCIAFDLPDAPGGNERKSARQKFEDRKRSWGTRIAGANRVTIELISAGGCSTKRLTRHPNERGIAWFFWDKEAFSKDWLAKRLSVTVKAAGERYSPELHVDLPVAFSLEGLAGSELFWNRYRERRANVLAAISPIERRGFTGIGSRRR